MLSELPGITKEIEKKFEFIYNFHLKTVHNLTSITERNEFYLKHFFDSIYIFKTQSLEFDTAMDIGSGGGFPGVPLSLLYPEKKIYLVESVKKKCTFLNDLTAALELTNVTVINGRVENLKCPKCDLILSRGVSKIKNLIKWTKNVSHETTILLAYKGENVHTELNEASDVLSKNNLEYKNVRIENPIKRTYTFIYRI